MHFGVQLTYIWDTMVIFQRSKNLLRIIIEKEVFHFNERYYLYKTYFHHIILKICVSGNTLLLQYQQMPLLSHISVIKGNSSMEMSIAPEEFSTSATYRLHWYDIGFIHNFV